MKILLKPLMVLILAITSLNASDEEQYQKAMQAYRAKDYVGSLKGLLALAKKGNARAQFNIGAMYDNGKGVRQDYHEAVKWYKLAANQGHLDAQLMLGIMRYEGLGVAKDKCKSCEWFAKSAKQGNKDAQKNYAILCKSNHCVNSQ